MANCKSFYLLLGGWLNNLWCMIYIIEYYEYYELEKLIR